MRKKFQLGEAVPYFKARTTQNDHYMFDSVAGRYIVLYFFGSSQTRPSQEIIKYYQSKSSFFDDANAAFFGVSIDPEDESFQRVKEKIPGYRFFWDFQRDISVMYGALEKEDQEKPLTSLTYYPFSLILDPNLRVLRGAVATNPKEHNKKIDELIKNLPPSAEHAGRMMTAPVLIVPRVFEPDFCKELIKTYVENGGKESGFMREVEGKTTLVLSDTFKKRKDHMVTDEVLRGQILSRIRIRLLPQVEKALQFKATRIERSLAACYDSQSGGFFNAHRDNTTKGTAHRQFAVTINLNEEEFTGGELNFPEYGPQTYRAPTGGAVVFSCSLLHQALPVTQGIRYAFLPFLYNDTGRTIREENFQHLSQDVLDLNITELSS